MLVKAIGKIKLIMICRGQGCHGWLRSLHAEGLTGNGLGRLEGQTEGRCLLTQQSQPQVYVHVCAQLLYKLFLNCGVGEDS